MSNLHVCTPETEIALNDPGDDVSSRYRFQWTWAAIVCCQVLDVTQDVVEVFCEHHEDVLIKHSDNSFSGHQVKTRGDDQPPWKSGDESVVQSCSRFAALESEYPGQFRKFYFLTNHPLHSAKNGQCINHILRLVNDAESIASLPKIAVSWLKRIGKKAGVTEDVVFAAMSKTVAKSELPKLDDCLTRLVTTLAQCWPAANECSVNEAQRVAQAFVDECGRASSLNHKQLLPAYLIANRDDGIDVKERIEGKRMTARRISGVLEQGRNLQAIMEGSPENDAPLNSGSTGLMRKKLDTGGFSIVSINAAEDLRDKADYLGIKWTKQFGYKTGLARYSHVRSLVLNDAGKAFDASQNNSDKFGPRMRDDLNRRLKSRREAGDELFNATDDHLEGVAFSLTAQCKIVWSHARPWETDDGSS